MSCINSTFFLFWDRYYYVTQAGLKVMLILSFPGAGITGMQQDTWLDSITYWNDNMVTPPSPSAPMACSAGTYPSQSTPICWLQISSWASLLFGWHCFNLSWPFWAKGEHFSKQKTQKRQGNLDGPISISRPACVMWDHVSQNKQKGLGGGLKTGVKLPWG